MREMHVAIMVSLRVILANVTLSGKQDMNLAQLFKLLLPDDLMSIEPTTMVADERYEQIPFGY